MHSNVQTIQFKVNLIIIDSIQIFLDRKMTALPSPYRLGQLRIRQLRLLVWLSEGSTLSSAAQLLHITAAAASQMLQEMEHTVGAQLFTRDRRGARPTAAGLALAQRAGVVLREFALLEQGVEQLHSQPLALLLGVIPQVMVERVPMIAQRYAQQYPGSLQVCEGTSPALTQAVKSGDLAAAIVRLGYTPDALADWEGLKMELLGLEQAAIAVPRTHALANKRRIRPEQLGELTWVLPERRSYIRNVLDQYFQLHQLGQPRAALQVTTTVQALWCAAQMGLAVAGPVSLIKRFSADLGLKALGLALGEPIRLGLIYRPSQGNLPQFQALHTAIVSSAGSPPR
jgi:DNA-binding transcriptional LysR family regulator